MGKQKMYIWLEHSVHHHEQAIRLCEKLHKTSSLTIVVISMSPLIFHECRALTSQINNQVTLPHETRALCRCFQERNKYYIHFINIKNQTHIHCTAIAIKTTTLMLTIENYHV